MKNFATNLAQYLFSIKMQRWVTGLWQKLIKLLVYQDQDIWQCMHLKLISQSALKFLIQSYKQRPLAYARTPVEMDRTLHISYFFKLIKLLVYQDQDIWQCMHLKLISQSALKFLIQSYKQRPLAYARISVEVERTLHISQSF